MRKITSLLILLCMFVGTAWAQPTAGTVYFLKDKHGTYLDIHNLGKEANDKSKDKLATLSANPQNLYITATTDGDKVYWQIHTTAVGGNYLEQHPSERRWNTWVSEGTGDFKWEVEELVESDITYYKLKNISGVENGYLGTDSHTDGQPLYVNNYGDKVLKLQLIEKPANEYYFEVPDGFTVTYNGEEYTNADAFIVEGELAAEDFAVNNVPAGYKASVTVDKENNKVIVTFVIDLTAFTDGTKWVFKNKQHNTYLGVMFDGGKLDNSIAPTTSYLTGFTTNNNYKNCWELVATTYNETECFYLYNPYYDWYASPIPSRNGRIGLSKTTDGAGFFQVESKGDYIAFKCMTYADEKYQYLHQVDWRNSHGSFFAVDWTADANASQWSCEFVSTETENDWLTAITSEVADKKAYLEACELGSGIGKYSGIAAADKDAVLKSLAIPAEGTTAEKIKAGVYVMYPLNALALNMPTAGFYRIKSLNGNDANKAGKYWQIKDDASAMEAGADKTINSIVYVKSNADKYNIVSYASGLYLNKYSKVDPAGTEAKAWSFVENTSVVGSYALYASADPNHPVYCLSDWAGITYGQKDANAVWTFEPVEALPVEVSDAGYATLYAPVALTLADGVEAYYVSAKSATSATMTQVTGVIPANTAVVLKAAKGTYNLAVASEADAISGNLLTGTLGSEFVVADAYVLSKQEEGIGFYKAKFTKSTNTENDGAEGEADDTYEAFLNNGFKAYLPASSASPARFITFDFGTETAIDELKGENGNVKTVIYDLSGRRVQKAQKGLYIVNGVKVIK